MAEPVLTARPGLCILKDPDRPNCVMGIELEWRAELQGDYCLHHSAGSAPLACWETSRAGVHQTNLQSRKDVSYWLVRGRRGDPLALITVRVLSLAERNPDRRRRRHVWSLL
jgi:hypothetical protein